MPRQTPSQGPSCENGPMPMIRLSSILPSLLFLLAASVSAGELPADFAEECGPASAKMQDAYEHATIRGTCRMSFPQRGHGSTTRTIDFVLTTDGDRMSLTESGGFEAADGRQQKARPPR